MKIRRLQVGAAIAGAAVCIMIVQNSLLAATPAPPRHTTPAPAWVPATLDGLSVQRENVAATLASDHRALWIDSVNLYSLRHGKELEATLEVGHFTASAPWQSSDFDLSLAGQLGASNPVVTRLGGVRVYITSTRGLGLIAWFEKGWMLILSVRSTYTAPKDLIRQAVELKP